MEFHPPILTAQFFRLLPIRLPDRILGIILVAATSAIAGFSESNESIESLSLTQLEDRKDSINLELSNLARYSLRSGIGPIGFRTAPKESPEAREFIQIDLERASAIDTVILVPAIWRDTQVGFQADGFPSSFRIVAGSGKEDSGKTIASVNNATTTRLAPYVVRCSNVTASWVRLEVERLSPRAFDGKYILQLSEILIFSDEENLALEKQLKTSSESTSNTRAWGQRHLVDGSLPYLMDSAHGSQSVSFVSTDIDESASIMIDLESPYIIDRINLHAVDQSDTVPQSFAGDFGFPVHLKVEGANQPRFDDAKLLLEFRRGSIYDVSQIVSKRLEPVPSRYIRITAIEPYKFEFIADSGEKFMRSRIGFAEIELYSNGENVALNKAVVSSIGPDHTVRSLEALTDGRNLYGNILPLQEWMLQLSRRHDLERELPLVDSELDRRYERQKANLQLFGWVIAGLIVCTVILFILDRFLRQRAVFRTKERIAADLHDELGANLHAIALLGDLAQAAKDTPEKAGKHLERIRALIQRTSESAKYVTNMLDTPGMYEDLIGEMRRSARRITTDLEHDLVIENEEKISQIKHRKRIDLFLFYNECLVNTIRHSGATKVETRLVAGNRDIILIVNDNGKGLPMNGSVSVPPSLKRRARLVGGKVSAANRLKGGACITLQMKF